MRHGAHVVTTQLVTYLGEQRVNGSGNIGGGARHRNHGVTRKWRSSSGWQQKRIFNREMA